MKNMTKIEMVGRPFPDYFEIKSTKKVYLYYKTRYTLHFHLPRGFILDNFPELGRGEIRAIMKVARTMKGSPIICLELQSAEKEVLQ
jgi:hypothetical protein